MKNPRDSTVVKLVFANKTKKDMLLFDVLEELQKTHKHRFSIHWVVEEPDSSLKIPNSSFGYVTDALIRDFLPKPCNSAKLLLCGPAPMISHILKESSSAGWPASSSSILKPCGPVFVF